MKKCLKIVFATASPDSFIQEIQKKGSKLGVEGTIQYILAEKELKIVVCGLKDQVDQFVDSLHTEVTRAGIINLSIEPFVKTKDYRGAFRVIE